MKKSVLKVLTTALAAAALTSMTVLPVFAQNTVIPKDSDWTGSDATQTAPGTAIKTLDTITVKDVTDTAAALNVTAYQIVKGSYKDGKLTGYVVCDPTNVSIADLKAPQASEITAIANKIRSDSTTLTGIVMTKGSTAATSSQYTANVEAGLYIVLVTNSDSVVYNPAVVAVNVKDANLVGTDFTEGRTVSMSDYFQYPTSAYLKSSESGVNKDIVAVNNKAPEGSEGDCVAYGDTVSFKVDALTIPSYSADYASPLEYKIVDKLDPDGFAGISSLSVKSGTTEIAAGENTYTIVYKNAGETEITEATEVSTAAVSYEITFAEAYIRDNGGKALEITYSSTFKSGAKVNYSEHKNTATVTYSNDPNDATKKKTKKATTYHYTFGIDADIDSGASGSFITNELNKVTEAGGTYTNGVSDKALAGAKFTLYSDADMQYPVTTALTNEKGTGTATSDANGHITFKGLDVGTYYLKETVAPEKYTLNANDYKIDISAELDTTTGVLTSYTIATYVKQTDGTYGQVRTATYTNDMLDSNFAIDAEGNVTNVISPSCGPCEIINTQLAALPATGGVGTIIITILAAVGMGVFLTIFIVSIKKKNDPEK